MAKADKQVIINFIIGCLRKGESRAAILGKVGKKWETSRTTFDRLLKTAKEEQNQTQQVIKKAKAALDIEIELQSHAELIADVHERKQTLTKIMRGQIQLTKPMVVNGILELVPVVPDWGERRSAISELNRMDGDYAPQKIAKTDVKGNDVNEYDYSQYTDAELRLIAELQRKGRTGSA